MIGVAIAEVEMGYDPTKIKYSMSFPISIQ